VKIFVFTHVGAPSASGIERLADMLGHEVSFARCPARAVAAR